MPMPQGGGFTVDPARIAAKLQEKNNELTYRVALVEAAFDQVNEEKQGLQSQLDMANARIAELEGSDDDDEDEAD